jgi:hypothetical protein
MSISVELSASTERQHEIELLGGRDENAKLPTGVLLGEHVAFETIDLKHRAHLLDDASEAGEIPAEAQGQLVYEGPGRREVRDPAALVVKLVERLDNPKLRDEGLAARRGEAHDDRAMTRTE